KPRFALAFGVVLALVGCAAAEPPPPSNPTVTAPTPPPPPTTPPPAPMPAERCPDDVQAATGKACSAEGQACGDPARSGLGIICKSGTWQAGEMPHPPCCKK